METLCDFTAVANEGFYNGWFAVAKHKPLCRCGVEFVGTRVINTLLHCPNANEGCRLEFVGNSRC
jgi:hypothetical protein